MEQNPKPLSNEEIEQKLAEMKINLEKNLNSQEYKQQLLKEHFPLQAKEEEKR